MSVYKALRGVVLVLSGLAVTACEDSTRHNQFLAPIYGATAGGPEGTEALTSDPALAGIVSKPITEDSGQSRVICGITAAVWNPASAAR